MSTAHIPPTAAGGFRPAPTSPAIARFLAAAAALTVEAEAVRLAGGAAEKVRPEASIVNPFTGSTLPKFGAKAKQAITPPAAVA